jgi:MOSC domain-containing protein YiiM
MKVVSVNTGLPKEVEWKGEKVVTGIFKYPTEDPEYVTSTGLQRDGQADLENHGGINKAVYAYPLGHYNYWQQTLNKDYLEPGIFGENLTTIGLLEHQVCLGNQYQIGSTVVMAIQPRMPCFKLGVRFNDATMTKQFLQARKNGIYFKVVKEGVIQKNDSIQLLTPSLYNLTIQDVADCFVMPEQQKDKVHQLLQISFLPNFFRKHFEKVLDKKTST